MEPKIKAIETRYAGVLFRSRLEARWACFMDAAKISWEYEPDRVALEGGGTYLADFRTNGSAWVEVKGAEENLDKPYLIRAAQQLGNLTVVGPIPECRSGLPGRTSLVVKDGALRLVQTWHDYRPGHRPRTYLRDASAGAEPWLAVPYYGARSKCPGNCPYDAARGARFEHGQSGKV